MTQAEFKNYIDNISVFERMKENLSTLKIDWETDTSKIDLSVLASGDFIPAVPGIKFNVKWVDINQIQHQNRELFIDGEIERFTELYKLIENGVKIIPPMTVRSIDYVDGVAQAQTVSKPVCILDGEHRIRLCKHINLTTMPVLFIDTPSRFTFSKAKWDFKLIGDHVNFSNKINGELLSFPLANIYLRLTLSGDYHFEVHQ